MVKAWRYLTLATWRPIRRWRGLCLTVWRHSPASWSKLCLLLWFEFFRTIALLLGALRDLIVGYSKSSSASVKCRREIFGRANFHPRVVSLGINVSSKVGDDGRRTGEGKELCRRTEKTPRHCSLDFSTSISSVYTDVLNLGILLHDITKRKNKVGPQTFKICLLVNFVFKT